MASTYKIKIKLLGTLNSYESYNTFIKFTKSQAISSSVEIIPTAAAAKSLQSCPTLCDSIDDSLPGSPVPGILQANMEWVAISFSNA